MQKRLLSIMVVLILAFNLQAKIITVKTAKSVAKSWVAQTALFQRHIPVAYTVRDTVMNIQAKNNTGQILAYVFLLKPVGYVIVAADDIQKPVVAYSDRENFIMDDTTQNIFLRFIRYDLGLQKKAFDEGLISKQLYRSEWRILSDTLALHKVTGVQAEIYGPHLSSKWGQGTVWNSKRYEYERVFNRFTPNYWPVGCVATAMAQMMNYYKWPLTGVGSHSYTEDDAGTISVNFGETNYDWQNMLDVYGDTLSTDDQKNAAGLLSYHCAVSVNMDFESDGSTSSTSDVPYALATYFRYTGHYETPSGYSSFYSRMRTNMENGRVDIIALADDNNNGHTVNVDGYDANNGYYHLNMGWLGSSNGWYNLQGSFNAGGYTSVTGAVLDIFPEPQMGYYYFSDSDPKTFTVTWQKAKHLNADYYQLQQKHNDGSWTTLSSSVADTFYTVTVSGDGTYYYRVRAHVDGYWWDDSYSVAKGVHVTSDGDYKTIASGNWSDPGIWQVYHSGWTAASHAPTSSDGRITVSSGTTVNVNSDVTVDEVVVQSNATLVILDGVDFSVNNGSGTDLRVYGTLRKEGSARILYTGSGTTTSKFYDGSLFQLAGSNKYILVADWEDSSTIEICGNIGGDMTSTYHTDQEFGNFIWNCSNQTSNVYFSGALTKIKGDFTLKNTNGYEVRLTGTAGDDPTVTVYGDVNIEGGILNLTSGDNNIYFICRGNFNQSGGTIKATGSGTGYLRFGPTSGGGYTGTFTHSGGTFTPENIQINNVFTLVLNSDLNIGTAPFTVNGVLNCGSYIVSGSGTFTLSSSGRIKIGHPDGLNGNIQTSGKSFSAAGDYEYIGNGDQVTGTYLPASLTDGLIIDAQGDVTLSQSTKLSGGNTGLILRHGRLMTDDTHLFTLANDGGWWGGSDESFVCGPMAKERASTNPFTFPTGKGHRFRRCRIIPASSASVTLKVEFFDQPFSDTNSLSSDLNSVSDSEYWYYERTSGSTASQVGLYWEEPGEISDISSVTVAYWDGTEWEDTGEVTAEGDNSSGRVTTNAALSNFGYFTFGEKKPNALAGSGALPKQFRLYQNYPNPFNSQTTIRVDLPQSSDLHLTVFNVLGQKVMQIQHKKLTAGAHKFSLNMNNLASGLYFYRVQAGKFHAVKKLLLVK